MMTKIIWSPQSEKEFANILQYLEVQWGNRVAFQFIDSVDKILQLIKEFPTMYPVIERKRKIHKCVLTKHITLYYRTQRNSIEILTLFDVRQDPRKLKL